MTILFRRNHVPTNVSLHNANMTIRRLESFCNIGTWCCCFLGKYAELNWNRGSRIRLTCETRIAALDPSISNEKNRQFLFRLDHGGAPTS